ncbi:61_t:CDS:2 [Dentiscutata erythropus]|uniref:61_t:CDS:1 n=1 Tax=Dentiscutata erythropus TaxID=1348616 RepID=A0A9N9DFQ2_9GLOM|nr:61_t:CDS:2 [Dentiscutata erythropus]
MTIRKKTPPQIPGFEHLHSDIVLIPGYRGSKLYNQKTKTTTWLNLQIPLSPHSKGNLDLPLQITKDEPDRFIPHGILQKIAFYKFYDSLIQHMDNLSSQKNSSSFKFHKFSYDWRRSNQATSDIFLEYLKKIYAANGEKPIYIFAHSNGGLITLSVLHRAPHLIAGVIFAGTPFGGAPGIFHELKFGSPVLFNKKLQDPTTIFTFRTAFHLLPIKCNAFKNPVTGKDFYIDYFDSKEWLNSEWSDVIFEDTPRNLAIGTKEERIAYLERVLDDTKKFHDSLKFQGTEFKYPPLVTIISNVYQSNGGYPITKNQHGKWVIDFEGLIPVKGDGSVSVESTKLPDGIPYEVCYSMNTHAELFEDLTAVGQAIEKIFAPKKVA